MFLEPAMFKASCCFGALSHILFQGQAQQVQTSAALSCTTGNSSRHVATTTGPPDFQVTKMEAACDHGNDPGFHMVSLQKLKKENKERSQLHCRCHRSQVLLDRSGKLVLPPQLVTTWYHSNAMAQQVAIPWSSLSARARWP